MNKNHTNSIGKRGETAAANFLKRSGYKILETNFSNTSGRKLGEIDIIAKEKDEIVFVEVKTRVNSLKEIVPEENITRNKLYKINKTAVYYLNKKKLSNGKYRFDAISIMADPEHNSAQLKHLKNIFY